MNKLPDLTHYNERHDPAIAAIQDLVVSTLKGFLEASDYEPGTEEFEESFLESIDGANKVLDLLPKIDRARSKTLPNRGGNTMADAPHDQLILAWCVHSADLFRYMSADDERLTPYGCHLESGSGQLEDGFYIVEWGGGNFDDYEDGAWSMPDWWFLAGSEFEQVVNPIMWWPLPDIDA